MLLTNVHNGIDRLQPAHIILILAALGMLSYANAVFHPFVHDDVVFLEKNPNLANLDLEEIFSPASDPDNKLSLINKYYRPVLELVNRLLFRIIGINPHGFHFFNILLHILNSFLVYLVIRFVIGLNGLSLAAAILFLLHPVQNEAVACISGISNLVFAFLCLMSFYAYLISAHSAEGKKRVFLYGTSLMFFLMALLAKEQAVVLPLLIIVHELCFLSGFFGKAFKKYWLPIGGFLLVLAGYFLLRKMLFGFTLLRPADNQGELWMRVLAIPRSLLIYLGLIFFPHDLHYYRSQDILLPFLNPFLVMLLVACVILFLIIRTPRPHKTWMTFGMAWFMISLAPVLNIVPLINEFSKIFTAEHFLYFPLMGMLFFVMGAGIYWLGQKAKISYPVGFLAFGAICAIFIGMNMKQNAYWRGEIPLFERTLQFQKDFGRVRFLLAKAYEKEGRHEEAVLEDRKALAIMKGYEQKVQKEEVKEFYRGFIKGIHYHLGYCLDILGKNGEALAEFKKALELEADNGVVHYSIGLSYLKVGDIQNAISYFEKSLELNKGDLMVMNSLAVCYQEIGRYDQAEPLLRTIAEKDSGSVSARRNLEDFLKKRQDMTF
ncbi:MAG: tetratricopeptide repeat protein [Candidatus Omnitrophica bacterium]|nr:tetratricopeptide repeat protein [Candidatus Omnitrophota bacterium]